MSFGTLILRNLQTGRELEVSLYLDKPVWIGRNHQKSFFSNLISRDHCEITIDSLSECMKIRIKDTSTNGTNIYNFKGVKYELKNKSTSLCCEHFGSIKLSAKVEECEIRIKSIKTTEGLISKDDYKEQGAFIVHKISYKIAEERADIKNPFGWKIHVLSFDFNDLIMVGNLVIPLLQKKGIAHKMVLPSKINELTGSQSGKAITIYPRDKKEFKDTAKKINDLLIDNKLGFKKEIKLDKNYERLLNFKGRNSYRLSYRNEFERKERGGKVSYEYIGKFFNISGFKDPFEKEID